MSFPKKDRIFLVSKCIRGGERGRTRNGMFVPVPGCLESKSERAKNSKTYPAFGKFE